MKHNLKITVELLLWTAIGLLFGFVVTPRILSKQSPALPVSPLVFIFIIIGILLIATWIWLKLFKKLNPNTLVAVFSGGIGAIIYRAITALFPLQSFGYAWVDIALEFCMIYAFGFTVYFLIKHMQKSWANVRKWYVLMNIIMMLVIPVVAVIMSKGLPLWATMLLLFLMACYDAYAVWKSKHMITLAKAFIKLRMLPGVVVPHKEKDKLAILGGGDVFFITFVSASAFVIKPFLGFMVMVGGFASLVFLFIASEKKKFYPAIPFIFAGIVLGLIIGAVL